MNHGRPAAAARMAIFLGLQHLGQVLDWKTLPPRPQDERKATKDFLRELEEQAREAAEYRAKRDKE
jgi:hypothetical protein